jgi:hypothetical protein
MLAGVVIGAPLGALPAYLVLTPHGRSTLAGTDWTLDECSTLWRSSGAPFAVEHVRVALAGERFPAGA